MILKLGDKNDKILRQAAKQPDCKQMQSEQIAKVKEKMQKALEKEKFGVAIAAPQVAEPYAIFLVAGHSFAHQKNEDFDPQKHKAQFFFNPKIVKKSKKIVDSDEGCLSVPFKYSYNVPRYEKVSIEYLDENCNKKIYNASGFLARVFQHEIDHLYGTLYIDKAKEVIDVDENLKPVKK